MWNAIINWINSKAYRCNHRWVQINEMETFTKTTDSLPSSIRNTYMCKKCAEHKTIKL